MVDLTRISNSLLTVAIAAWALATVPAGHAADAPAPTQKSGAAVDLTRQETELRSALSANPNDAGVHVKLGRIYLEEGKFAAAEAEARAARHGGGQNDDADAVLAWALFLENEKNVLFAQIKPGQREAHAESEVRLTLGLAHLDPLELDSAEPLLRDAVRLDPNSWRAHIALARFLILKRKLPEAREQLEAARALAPGEIGIMRITGELDRAEGDTDGAIAEFSKVIELHPTSLPALAGRADALISENKLPEAQRDVAAAFKVSSNPQVLFLDALLLARQGKMAEADQLLVKASPAFSHIRIGYYLHGVVKFWLGEPETAEYHLAKFQGQQPNVSGVARLRAEIAFRRKDPTSAIKLLKPVVEANPADQAAVTGLARAYLANSQPEQVLQLYEQVTAAPPGKVAPPVDFAGLLMNYGDAFGDLAEIEKIIMKRAPDAVMPMTELRQGNVAKASSMAESLAEKDPNNPVILNLLGSVRLAQKRLPDAEAIFRGILDKSPDFTAAAFNLVEVLVAEKRLDEAKVMLHDLAHRSSDDF